MISNNLLKYIRSLHLKKTREAEGKYLIEGDKIVDEAISENLSINKIFAATEWIEANESKLSSEQKENLIEVDQKSLQKIGQLTTVNRVVALVEKRNTENIDKPGNDQWTIALDRVQDPGNMGTIIRTADWFGIENLVCSKGCVEIYNPKVIQSAMGSLFRLNVITRDLTELLQYAIANSIPIYGAALSGENLSQIKNPKPGILLFGNESQGLSEEILSMVSQEIRIPGKGKAESLNVAIAAGIITAWATT